MHLLFDYFYAYVNRDKFNTNLYKYLIGKLHSIRQKYLNEHKITVIDKSPFQDFTLKCYGVPVDQLRESLLSGLEKIKKGHQVKFTYNPSRNTNVPKQFHFDNVSGNMIINKNNLIIN